MLSSPDSRVDEATSKRKRDIIPEDEDDKLEIDVNLPEPPSKKAKRKEKKQTKQHTSSNTTSKAPALVTTTPEVVEDTELAKPQVAVKRSEYGVWIGNLPFSVTKDSLRQFLHDQGGIDEQDVTRVHLPSGEKGQNKGFAYVDVTTPSVLQIALALSEKMIGGRRVLIKDAKSFEGRPEKPKDEGKEGTAVGNTDGKREPSKRIFVGNLGFDVTKDEVTEHFSQAGPIEDVFMATFEDSGKCKGFGWVRFATLEAAANAVRGFIYKDIAAHDDDDDHEDDADGDESATIKKQKPRKPRKYFINRIHGRTLRCEFAEDAQTRYKKRFGQRAATSRDDNGPRARNDAEIGNIDAASPVVKERPKARKPDKDERREERRKRHDARTVAPGKALAGAHRATGAIVAGAGKKVVFD